MSLSCKSTETKPSLILNAPIYQEIENHMIRNEHVIRIEKGSIIEFIQRLEDKETTKDGYYIKTSELTSKIDSISIEEIGAFGNAILAIGAAINTALRLNIRHIVLKRNYMWTEIHEIPNDDPYWYLMRGTH